MTYRHTSLIAAIITVLISLPASAQWTSPYAQWENGPPTDPSFFPIAVWAQMPMDAARYKAMGVNIYIGLTGWRPISSQISIIQDAEVHIIAHQDSTTLAAKDLTLSNGESLIIAWRQEDEPDNYPPTSTTTIQNYYNTWTSTDPTRPIWLNLSQGIGNGNQIWSGQGGAISPAYHYPLYLAGCDIASFDIYPMCSSRLEIYYDAWRPAYGVDGLFQYSQPGKIVWNVVETGDIHANGLKATPEQIRMQVWSSIIHGSTGICYFIHGYSPDHDFDVNALFHPDNEENRAGVERVNNEIHLLAPVINSEAVALDQVVTSIDLSNTNVPVDAMARFYEGATYLFTTSMREWATTATFHLNGNYPSGTVVKVIGEDRQLMVVNNSFSDDYDDYQAHLYRIDGQASNFGPEQIYLLYNDSAFDGNDAAANAADDNALAIDKYPLYSGQTASFANYSSYDKGINGLVIDYRNAPGELTFADFEFHTGNNSLIDNWPAAAAPLSVTTRTGAGVNGSDRVTILWQDYAIMRQWLQVTIKATANTGLVQPVVFYYGNAVGDTGDRVEDTYVDASDEVNCRNNPRNFLRPAAVDDVHDFNRDGKVDATDQIITRYHTTNLFTALRLITAP